jgi:CHAT domain-containing protein
LKFALLECEFLLARDETKPAAEILSGLPDGIPDVRLRAYRRMLDGYLSLKTGEYRTASEALQEALALADAAGDGERKTAVLLILGNVRDSEGRLEEAEACWGRALEQARAGNDVFNEAAALNNIGVSNLRRYRFEEAAGCFEPVLRSAERLGANLMRAAALGNIALCRYEVGDFEQAIQLRRQANAIAEQAGARLYELQGIGELGTILLRSDRPAEAAPEYRRALDLARTLHEPHETVLWSAQLAAALIRTGQYKEAGTLNQQALASAEPVRDSDALNQARMNAADMAASLGQSEEAAGRYKDLIRRQETPAYFRWEAHAGLAAVYRKLGRLDDASAEYGNAIALIEHARSDLARQDSMISFLSQLIRVYREYVDFLVDRGEDEQALKIADSSRARVLLSRLRRADASPRTFTVRRLQEIAAAHRRVFLSYWVAPAHTYLWIISGKVFQRHTLPGNAELQKLVEAHRAILEEGWRDPLLSGHPAGRELFRTLILPVRDFIPKETQVVLIPDGPLHLLNLETLPVEDEKPRYWIDDVTVTVMQSLSSAADEQPARTRQTSSILLLGDPQPADPRFPRLRHAGVELASVCRHFPAQSVNLLTGLNATPDSYRESHPERYTWIHFACHANAMQASPLESAVILSQGRTGYKLFAGEILEESLNAELVTVSACRGVGIRSYSGEGLVGFAWAFLKAGARNVIAGLWDVSDRSTAMLMDDLYAGLQAGLPPPEALRQAKLHLLHSQGNFAKPFYWGPFQLYSRGL